MPLSVQPSSVLSRVWARISFRAGALRDNICAFNSSRSSDVMPGIDFFVGMLPTMAAQVIELETG